MSQINPEDLNNQQVAESQCHTKAELKKCTFSWTINHYPVLARRREILKSSSFCAASDDFKWHLEHSLDGHPDSTSTSVILELCPNSEEDLEKHGSVSGNVVISVLKTDRSKLITKTNSFTLKSNEESPSFKCEIRFFTGLNHLAESAFQGQLTFLCELSYVKSNSIVNISSPCCSSPIEIPESSLPTDLGRLYFDDCFKDLTISVKEKNYLVHKAILAIRSSVFDAMFRNDMQESSKNRIVINDLEEEIFEEMLHYIYTGKTKNLDELAFELLPVANKYDLKELRIMCENVLLKKLSADNAVKILILADVHHAEGLKKGTLEFIKVNFADCEDLKNAAVWNDLATTRAQLLKDMLDAFCKT
ncbi:speckle-type POZ protein-like isoform X1 [Planococcus citri]|uniref:speckle-type POZ protein-like isoform X1 n=1 Tax=Planococcus citri TaxID=170843 RepID=UPI0031FA3324